MSFAALWPLAFLAAIPAIIILYILRPRGKDTEISSNLLWNRFFKNHQSKTFWEKFKSDILMYLQLIIMLLLILSLMAPFVLMKMQGGGSTVLVIDNSMSMQHTDGNGRSRLEEAKKRAVDFVNAASGEITVMTVSSEAQLIIARSTDHSLLRNMIGEIEPTQTEGSLADAYQMAAGLETDAVVIYTDGDGEPATQEYTERLNAQVVVCGEVSENVSLDFAAMTDTGNGTDVSVRYTNYGNSAMTADVTLYDAQDQILNVRSVSAEAGSSGSALFTGMQFSGTYLRAEISNIRFAEGKGEDSLAVDDMTYAIRKGTGSSRGLLVGQGNTFIERAYYAAVGADLSKAESDAAAFSGGYTLVIYDAGFSKLGAKRHDSEKESTGSGINALQFAPEGTGTLSNVLVKVSECELTAGLKEFTIGANTVVTYDCPEWATPFMEADGKCVGYYGIAEDHREVVVGFDVRETDFPVKAEFPVFMAQSVNYLSSLSLLAKDSYQTGESLLLNPSSMQDVSSLVSYRVGDEEEEPVFGLSEAGLYVAQAGEQSQIYLVQAPNAGRDGRAEADGSRGGAAESRTLGRRGLRNFLLIAALVLLIVEWILYVRKNNYRKRFYLILRIALMALIVLSLLGLRIRRKSRETTTIFLVDLSVSNEENLKAVDDYIDDQLHDMPKNNSYGIVTFGRDAVVDQFITDRDMYMGLNARTDESATNFEMALQRAASMLPPDTSGRIVVLTDGKQTAGQIDKTSALFASGEISLETVLFDSTVGNDVYVRDVQMPEVLHNGESYYMTVSAESNYETDATVEILSGGKPVGSERVHLMPGGNSFVFEETVRGDEVESYEIRIIPDGDTCEENNSYSAYARVEEAPHILVLRGRSEDAGAFMNLLDAAHVNADFMRADRAPETLPDLLEYKAIILENAYKDELPEGFLEQLETYVRDYGGGLICCGGEDSYMVGGYNDSVIETVLPVNMELRGTLQMPSTAIVMVIDHSGSMTTYAGHGATYLDVAVEAAKRGVDNLRPTDEVGILAFDDTYTWAHRLSHVENPDAIKQDIERITDGGGTVILPALQEARTALHSSNAQVRHIILLTDGYGETNDFSSVTDKLVLEGITLSTVAVGEYSDQMLMERLAREAGGRYYYADGDADIPRIFAQEVYLGGDTYIKNGNYAVAPVAVSELTSGLFTSGWYDVLGYNATSPKTGAQELLRTSQGDPLLAVWQYGLGKTVAWTADVDGGWTSSYVSSEEYVALWKRLADYVTGAPDIGADYMDVESADGRTTLTYHTQEYSDATEISGIYTGPDGEGGEYEFVATEPGVYTATINSEDTGLYNINVRRSDDGQISGAFTTATVIQYSDEYRFDVSTTAYEEFIRRYGKVLDPKDYLWEKLYAGKNASFSLTEIFLILLILLYLSDIAGRRFGYEPLLRKKRRAVTAQTGAVPVPQGNVQAPEMVQQAGTPNAGNMASAPGSTPAGAGAAYGKAAAAQNYGAQAPAAVPQAPVQPAKKESRRKAAKAPQEESGGLDTSALLQKKRDRNV